MKPRTRRILKIVAVVVLLLVAVPAVPLASAFIGISKVEDGKELAPGARVVKDGYTSLSMLDVGDGKVALIDAGDDKTGKSILAALAKKGLDAQAVTAILLTHGHPDHTAACPLFPNAKIYALAAEVPLIEGTAGAKSPLSKVMSAKPTGIHVTNPVADGDTITLGATKIRVFAVPGHTAGSAAYLADGALYLGDSAAAETSGKVRGAPWLFSDDQAQNVASLHALGERLRPEAATIKYLVPAHSGVLEGLSPLLEMGH